MQDMNQYGDIVAIRSEAVMTDILKHFSSDYILGIMCKEIDKFKTSPMDGTRHIQNIVPAIEIECNDLLQTYPHDKDNILMSRNEIYNTIILTIANAFNIIINIPDDNMLMEIAKNLYQFFICDLNRHIITFYTNFILANIDSIYDAISNYIDTKKNKSIYVYQNPKTQDILNNMNVVINTTCAMEIPIELFMQSHPSYNILKDYVMENESFFKTHVFSKLSDYNFSPVLLASIKLLIHNSQLISQPTIETYLYN